MNLLTTMTGADALANLEQWALVCHEAADEKWPRVVLEVAQIATDILPRSTELADHVARKRAVFDRVATGDTIGAIKAIIPSGFEVEVLSKRTGAIAIIRNGDGIDARSTGVDRERALLGAVIQLVIRLCSGDLPRLLGKGGPAQSDPDTSIAA